MPIENRRRRGRRTAAPSKRADRALIALAAVVALAVLVRIAVGGGSGHGTPPAVERQLIRHHAATVLARSHTPRLSARAATTALLPWTTVVTLGGLPAVALERVAAPGLAGASVTLLRLDQSLVALQLHAGSIDPGGTWLHGPEVVGAERHRLIGAFNGGFKFSYSAAGFELDQHVVTPLRHGLASIVTYADGRTDIGWWGGEVPRAGEPLADVRQNGHLLIDHGAIATTVDSCVLTCWGATVGSVLDTARSALGITGSGALIWAGGEGLSVRALAEALREAGALRAIELDVNPDWVAAYLYGHGGPLAPLPVVPGQVGIAGELTRGPDTRDFFTVLAR